MMEDGPSMKLRETVTVPPLRTETNEKFHAFIAHSSDDGHELSENVTKGLEELGFKCCYADRDFQGGSSVISNIDNCITSSRRVIVLITNDFLKSDWFTFETANSLTKGYIRGEKVMIPVLHKVDESDVPTYIKEVNYIDTTQADFWQRLVRAIVVTVPISAMVPAGNVAHGLAWSYHYGFLAIILPSMKKRMADCCFAKEPIPFFRKLVILLPQSCYCPPDAKELDDLVVYQGHLPYTATRAGNIRRDYKSAVYKVTDPEDRSKEYYLAMEFATPLMSMYEMEQGATAGLNKEQKFEQMKLFKDKMQAIFNYTGFNEKVLLVEYPDRAPAGKDAHTLSALLARVARHGLKQEEAMEQEQQANGDPQN